MDFVRACGGAALVLGSAACAADRVTAPMPAAAPVVFTIPGGAALIRAQKARWAASDSLLPPCRFDVVHRCRGVAEPTPQPLLLVFINGRPLAETRYVHRELDPEWVTNVEILRGPEAVARFGPTAADGVVLITMEPGHR